MLATLGEKVEAGQVLARLDSKTLELQYKQAEGNVAALSSPAEIASAEQAVQDAKASLATAKDDLQFLIGPDVFVAEQKLADAQEGLEAAKAAVAKDASDANKQKLSTAESELADAQKTVEYAFKNYSNSYTLQTFTYPIRNEKGVTKRRELIAPTDAELLAARADLRTCTYQFERCSKLSGCFERSQNNSGCAIQQCFLYHSGETRSCLSQSCSRCH